MKHHTDEIKLALEVAHAALSERPEHAPLKVLLNTTWKLNESVATCTKNQGKLEAKFDHIIRILERLDKLMAFNTTTLDQNSTDAKSAVTALATSHGSNESAGQAIIDKAAADFAQIRDIAKAATPADTTSGGAGSDTTPGTGANPPVIDPATGQPVAAAPQG